jgi:hypothetical protein
VKLQKTPWGSAWLVWLLLGRPIGLCVGRVRGGDGLLAQISERGKVFSSFFKNLFSILFSNSFCYLKIV